MAVRALTLSSVLLSATFLTMPFSYAEDDSFLLDQITLTSTKTQNLAIDALSGTSVISRQTLEQFQPDSVSEIFRGVPGVETQSDGNDPSSAINIRGLQDFGRVNVLIEGARQDFQRSGHGADGVFYLDPELIRMVDITRGPVSTIFGSGAIGGVVNFELIDADDIVSEEEKWAARQKVSYDTNDTGVLSSSLFAIKPNAKADFLGNFVFRHDDDYRDGSGRNLPDTGETLLNGLVKGKYRPEEGHEFTTIISHQDSDYRTSDTDFSSGSLRETDTRATNIIAKYDFDSPNNPLINFKSSFYFTETNTDQTQLEASTSVPVGNERSFNVRTFGLDIFNTSEFETGPVSHQFTYGFDAYTDRVNTSDPLGTGDEFTPSGRRTVIGGFIQDQLNYSSWLEVIGALRFDHYDLSANGLEGLSGSNVSPKVTVGITPIEGIQFFGTYAQGFRAPAVTEVFNNGTHDPAFPFTFLPNPQLNPETAENFEFGTNLKFNNIFATNDKFRAKATYFHNTIDNFIEADVRGLNAFTCFALPNIPQFPPFGGPPSFLPPTGCGDLQYINIANARIKGFELEASYEIDRYFGTLAYSRIRGDDTNLNQPLESIRPDTFSATLGARFKEDDLVVGGRLTHVQQQERIPLLASDGSDNILPGLTGEAYTLVDLFATYNVNDRTQLGLALNNITNQEYTKYLDVNASEGFSASLTASFKIGG